MPGKLLIHSLKARVTLFTLAIFLVSTVCLGVYVSTLLRADLRAILTAQQYATAEHLAEEIDGHLLERLTALEQVARLGGARVLQNDVAAQRMLNELPVFQNLFNGGTFITDTRGMTVASAPMSVPRVGVSYADRDYIQNVMSTGKPAIGRPTISRALDVPVVVMAVPIRDMGNNVIGVLAGVTNLNRESFLDRMGSDRVDQVGIYRLVSARDRIIITSSSKSRVMEPLPAPGMNPTIDRFVAGFEGTKTFINPEGIEVLASIKRLSLAPWYVAVTLPTQQVFAPVISLQERVLVVLGLLTLAAGALSWWMIRRQLSPLRAAAQTLASTTQGAHLSEQVQPLPVGKPDEIGQLILSFNTLLVELARQRTELKKSEMLYSTAFQTSPDAFSITRIEDGCFLKINESFTRIFGWKPQDIIGRTSKELGIWRHLSDRLTLIDAVTKRGRCENLEVDFVASNGTMIAVQVSATIIEFEGAACMLAVTHDISARKAAQAQIERLAFSDPLTGLPNRRLFMDRLNQAVPDCRRHGRRGALYFIDLDDFKSLNDNLGHDKGDLLLRAVGQALSRIVTPGDTVARLGGDEFVILFKDLPHEPELAAAHAKAMGDSILALLNRPIKIEGTDYHGSASVGMVLFGPETIHAADLIKQADLAMYHAKATGRNRLCIFTPELQANLSLRAEMEADLRTALREQQFHLLYQVQTDQQGRIFGVEALLRWQHPVKGLVSPAEFIPLAEKSGLILPLGRWVLETACRQLADWAGDPLLSSLTMGVNVSSRQFQQFDFVDQVLHVLQKTGARASLLKLELTESLLVDNIEDVAAKMKALRAEGVCFSLDDFGTGFSSLAYLKSLPLDELKIDQGFVRHIEADLNDLAIARTVVALGDSLGLRVMAEGVETDGQRQALAGIGCHRCQGYFFGKPSPVAQIEARVREQALATA